MHNILVNLERVRPTLFPGVLGLLSIGFGMTVGGWILSSILPPTVLLLGVIAGFALLGGLVLLTWAAVSRSILIHRH